ncbi:SURF1 family protein [Aureimonas sp. ME7]|uniref:SURF1 family protein n=1 Tax=Aureimonas sp. ME7 TaxID=2744252 RepID=UPI001FCEF786|nr:SURF1 family protein [Aureimonas sp. ME7]
MQDFDPNETIEPKPMTRGRIAAVVVVCLGAIAVLTALGAWQVERLFWKEGLIATIDARIHAAPVDIATVEDRERQGEEIDYTPVRLDGRFLHDGERYFLATNEGAAGWHVLTPMVLGDGNTVVFVNRGFVPYDRKDPATRVGGNPSGSVSVTGLARAAPTKKPNYFVPDNDPARNAFFWRSIPDMAQGLSLPAGATLLPFLVDADRGDGDPAGPVGGTTVVEIPNNHLEYAITWFALAFALMVIFLLFLRWLWRRPKAAASEG